MASHRTTIVLTETERRAAKRLAVRWGVTPSEAIRRAIRSVDERDESAERERVREKRSAQLDVLFKASAQTRAQVRDELAALSAERDGR